MGMNLRYMRRLLATIGVVLATFIAAPGAMAGIIGSATLDITNGTFYYDSARTSSFTIFGPTGDTTNHTFTELATGDFAYTNTLPSSHDSFNRDREALTGFPSVEFVQYHIGQKG